MRSSLRALLSLAVLSLLLPAVAAAEFAGLDDNGNLQCDSIDMVQTATAGDVGSTRTIDVFFTGLPNPVINLGCVFCVGNKNLISSPTFTFSTPSGWTNISQNTGAGPWGYTLADTTVANYPDYLCFGVSGTDFTGANPIGTFPAKLGTLQYQVAQEGCIQWLFDGPPNLAALTVSFSSLTFDGPGETCPPRACPSAVEPLAIDESTPACPIPDATKGVQYAAGTVFTATGGTPPYTWSQSGLPEGMNINSTTGEIVGTPTQAGPFSFVVTVNDGASGQAERNCSIFVAEYGVSVVLLSADTTVVGDPDTTIHEFRVQNTGNVQTTFDLSAWSVSGFGTVILGGSTTTLQPGANSSHQVRHLIPEVPCPNPPPYSYDRAHFRAKYSVTVPAPATLADDTASAVVAIAPDAGVSVTYADDSQCITPGTTGTDYFIVENIGECPDTFNLSVSANLPAWSVSIVGNPWIFLVPGNPESIAVSVGVPSSAPCTEAAAITFTATARHYWVSMPETGDECAAAVLDGTLSDESNQVGAPGDTVEYCFMVQNTGNCAASFAPAFQSVWPVLYTGGSFPLQVGQSVEKCVKHIIPGSAQDGNQDQLCVFLEASPLEKDFPVRVDTSCVTTTAGVPCESFVDVVHTGYVSSCFEPGGTQQDTFTVQNTGSCGDVFDLTAQAGSPGWTAAVVGSSSIGLDPTALASVYVNVTAPAGALCTDVGSVTLTAEGQVYGATETAGSGDYCVIPVIKGTVSQPGNQTGAPGDTVLYDFVMKNTGNCPQAFGLEFSSLWANVPGTAEAFLDPGDTAIVSVGHVVPGSAEEGDSDELCATLIPVLNKGGRPSPLDTSCVVTTAALPCVGGIDVTGDTFLNGVPGESLYADFFVQNLGNGPDRFLLLATSTEGWDVSVFGSDTTDVVAPGAYNNVEVLIVIPHDALCGATDHVQLLAQSLCDPVAWDTQSVAVEVDPFCAASVVALTEDTTGTPGQGMDYLFRVTNEGNCQFEFQVVVTQSVDWDTSYGSTVESIPVGGHYDFPFHVDIPATAQPGDEHKVIVCTGCVFTGKGRQPGEACDSTITRVPTGCEADEPILSLGDYRTVSYGGPGGQWQVQVALKNNGPGKAQSIAAQMHHDLAWLYLVDGMCTYPDLDPGALSYGVDSYTFDLRDYPGGSFNVWFDVTYTDSCGNAYQTRLDPTFSNPGGNGLPSPAVAGLVLHQNVPNPFNPETSISFELPSGVFAELTVYNTAGQSVRTLWAGTLPAGLHTFVWNGESDRGTPVPSGTYFYSVRSDGRADTKRMVLVR